MVILFNAMKYLDLRGQTWNQIIEGDVAKFLTKREASAFARSCGWSNNDVIKAANRFCNWWVIGQMQSTDSLTLLRNDKGVTEVAFPGYW